jgi:hypothetical protein
MGRNAATIAADSETQVSQAFLAAETRPKSAHSTVFLRHFTRSRLGRRASPVIAVQ